MIHFMRYVCYIYIYIFFFLNIQVEIGNYDLYFYAIVSQIFECCKGGFFGFKLTFGLASDPNKSSPNRKTAPTPHHTKPHRTASKLIFISASAGAYNRKTAL